jgi:hypothetical protein
MQTYNRLKLYYTTAMRSLPFTLFFLCCSFMAVAQPPMMQRSLSTVGVSLKLDATQWRQVQYAEIKKINDDIDTWVELYANLAMLIYIPKGEKMFKDELSVIILVDSVNGKRDDSWKVADSTFSTAATLAKGQHFLAAFQGGKMDENTFGKRYFDTATQSLIVKNSTVSMPVQQGFGEVPPGPYPRHYFIVQSRQRGKYCITIEYRCHIAQEKLYFPLFEKIMASLSVR